MPHIKVISDLDAIPNPPDPWICIEKFRSHGVEVDGNGKRIAADYRGTRYVIMTKRERKYLILERIARVVIGYFIAIATLWTTRNNKFIHALIDKNKQVVRYAVPAALCKKESHKEDSLEASKEETQAQAIQQDEKPPRPQLSDLTNDQTAFQEKLNSLSAEEIEACAENNDFEIEDLDPTKRIDKILQALKEDEVKIQAFFRGLISNNRGREILWSIIREKDDQTQERYYLCLARVMDQIDPLEVYQKLSEAALSISYTDWITSFLRVLVFQALKKENFEAQLSQLFDAFEKPSYVSRLPYAIGNGLLAQSLLIRKGKDPLNSLSPLERIKLEKWCEAHTIPCERLPLELVQFYERRDKTAVSQILNSIFQREYDAKRSSEEDKINDLSKIFQEMSLDEIADYVNQSCFGMWLGSTNEHFWVFHFYMVFCALQGGRRKDFLTKIFAQSIERAKRLLNKMLTPDSAPFLKLTIYRNSYREFTSLLAEVINEAQVKADTFFKGVQDAFKKIAEVEQFKSFVKVTLERNDCPDLSKAIFLLISLSNEKEEPIKSSFFDAVLEILINENKFDYFHDRCRSHQDKKSAQIKKCFGRHCLKKGMPREKICNLLY